MIIYAGRTRTGSRLRNQTVTEVYHEGELAVQARAGVSSHAQRVGRIIASTLPEGASGYLGALPVLFHGTTDPGGDVWASALTGEPGFIDVVDDRTIEVKAAPAPGDPAELGTGPDGFGGFLAIDLATRQRFRFNGRVERDTDLLRVHVQEAFGNCPKYIQLREVTVHDAPLEPSPAEQRPALVDADRALIQAADTFFIASIAAGRGVDVSHRGGEPGFVRVSEDGAISFRDYPGNNMFQTLGNLTADGRAGLLFVDFRTGTMLQLTGRAVVNWSEVDPDDLADTGRSVMFEPTRVVRTERAIPLRWVFRAYSPFNPPENQENTAK